MAGGLCPLIAIKLAFGCALNVSKRVIVTAGDSDSVFALFLLYGEFGQVRICKYTKYLFSLF